MQCDFDLWLINCLTLIPLFSRQHFNSCHALPISTASLCLREHITIFIVIVLLTERSFLRTQKISNQIIKLIILPSSTRLTAKLMTALNVYFYFYDCACQRQIKEVGSEMWGVCWWLSTHLFTWFLNPIVSIWSRVFIYLESKICSKK